MKKELEEKLREEAPIFMAQLYGDVTETCMHFGCECMDGWFSLIEEAATKIEQINSSLNGKGQIQAAQIKEKFGELTIYLSSFGEVSTEKWDEACKIISDVEGRSWDVCERCGAPATETTKGWITRLCKKCLEERNKERSHEC